MSFGKQKLKPETLGNDNVSLLPYVQRIKEISRIFTDWLSPPLENIRFAEYEENARRASITITCITVFLTCCMTFLIWKMRRENIFPDIIREPRAFPYIFLLVLSFIVFWGVQITRRYQIACWIMGLSLTLMAWRIVPAAGLAYGGPINILFIPPLMIFGLGLGVGLPCSLLMGFGILLIFLSPPSYFNSYEYDPAYEIRYFIILSLSTLFSVAMEVSRLKTRRQLVQMAEKMEYLALKDPLTGCGNRRDFYEHFAQEKARALRKEIPLSLCMCDIDHFKKFNDQYGHECGDETLKHVTDVLHATLRREDSLFRWGGEEFLILLSDTNLDEARKIAERLRSALTERLLSYEGKELFITLSFGVGLCDLNGTIDVNIHHVDEALYKAKKQGRNRVECWEEKPASSL